MLDERVILAARNNADLYQAMFLAQGLRYEITPHAFVAVDAPPPYYSNLVVLAENASAEVISHLKGLARRSGGQLGLKDSFCEYDLRANGFEKLFEACWIWRNPETGHLETDWIRAETARDLEDWEAAWKRSGSPTEARMFREEMLQMPDIAFLGKRVAGAFVAGCIANISGDCIGISNVFSVRRATETFREATAAVMAVDRSLPIIGYEAGGTLDLALAAGYEATGPLRILRAENAQF